MDLSLSGGEATEATMLGSCGWPVIVSYSLNSFTYSLFTGFFCCYFVTEGDICSSVHPAWFRERDLIAKNLSQTQWQDCIQSIWSTPATLFFTGGFAGRFLQVCARRQDVHLCYLSLHSLIRSCVSVTVAAHLLRCFPWNHGSTYRRTEHVWQVKEVIQNK